MKAYLTIGSALAAVTLAAAPAHATVKIDTIGTTKGSKSGTINFTPFNFSTTASVGQFQLTGKDLGTGAAVSLKTFCTDIFNTLKAGTFTRTDDADFGKNYATKQDQLLALLGNTESLINSADTSAAVQLAVWEIAYENSTTSYSLSNGWFNATGSALDSAKTLANSYLGKVTKGDWKIIANTQLNTLTADGNQDQVWISPAAAVPEPASWAMMIAGFGLIGTAMRRRTTVAVAA